MYKYAKKHHCSIEVIIVKTIYNLQFSQFIKNVLFNGIITINSTLI